MSSYLKMDGDTAELIVVLRALIVELTSAQVKAKKLETDIDSMKWKGGACEHSKLMLAMAIEYHGKLLKCIHALQKAIENVERNEGILMDQENHTIINNLKSG